MQEKVDYRLTIAVEQEYTDFRGPFDLAAELMCVLRDWGVQQSDYFVKLEVVKGEES